MPEPLRSADFLVDELIGTPGLLQQAANNPEMLRTVAKRITKNLPSPAFVSDKWTYRIVVIALGVVCVGAMSGAIYMSATGNGGDQRVPNVVTALGSAAIGALAGLLAPSPTVR